MNRRRAAARDAAADRWKEAKVCFKVGSPMKGCHHCGELQGRVVMSGPNRGSIKVMYVSGFNVFRAYDPAWTKWTWKCMDCLKTDLECWAEDEHGMVLSQLGRPPILAPRNTLGPSGKTLQREAAEFQANVFWGEVEEPVDGATGRPATRRAPDADEVLLEIERQILRLSRKLGLAD